MSSVYEQQQQQQQTSQPALVFPSSREHSLVLQRCLENIIVRTCLAAVCSSQCVAVSCVTSVWQSVCCLPAWAPSMCRPHYIYCCHTILLPHFILPHTLPQCRLVHCAVIVSEEHWCVVDELLGQLWEAGCLVGSISIHILLHIH